MNRTKLTTATLALLLLAGQAAFAQDAMVKGEVKKVDETAKKITLKHGPIKSLGMEDDGMTMVFKVQDPAMLKQVKAGDKVQFTAERGSDGIAITKIQKSK
jgi:Cu(I)/Ag(I) efflux system protein CusF